MKATTWERVRKYQVATLIEHFGSLRLSDIDVETIERYKAARLRAGISPGTINDEWKVLRTILGYAHELGALRRIPRVKLLRTKGRGRAVAWTPDEVGALYTTIDAVSPDVMPLVVCLLNTGMRKGEAIALERDNVDLDRNLIRLWPSEDWQPKDNRPREVPVSGTLRPWLTRTTGRWVFPSRRGSRYAYWPQRAFDRARKAAGLDGGPHTARHTFASEFLANGGKLYELARILGHSVRKTTDRYSHFSRDYLDESRDIVNFAPPIGAAEWTARQRWNLGDKT